MFYATVSLLLPESKPLLFVMLVSGNSTENIILYISCVQNHVPVIMVDAKISRQSCPERQKDRFWQSVNGNITDCTRTL